jgi:transposase
VEDGKSLTFTSRSRNSKSYLKLLQKIERAIPRGLIYLIADNLKIHDSALVRKWLEGHPRMRHAFIPKGAAWLNLIEGWWRIFRRQALAGVDFADRATRSIGRVGSPLGSRTAKRSHGYGADLPSRRGIGGALLCTVFEERSTKLARQTTLPT